MTQNQTTEVELIDGGLASMKVDENVPVGSTSDTASISTEEIVESTSCDNDVVLTQLARQLEYYFSKTNLSKDTYVQTLRELNDGYVPISILANFAKVQMLVPYDAISAIVKSTNDFSTVLEVVAVDTKTGKRVENESPRTIWAVGTVSREPLDYIPPPLNTGTNAGASVDVTASPGGALAANATPNDKSPVQNTIILRDVDSQVTEEHIRALFNEDEQFPPVQSLYLDVASCWFVTLDTSSRDDILNVMLQLRSKTLCGEPVKARLKSNVRQIDTTMAPALPLLLTPSPSMTQMSSYDHLHGTPNKKKKKKRSKNKHNKKVGNNSFAPRSSSNNSSNNNNSNDNRRSEQSVSKKTNSVDAEPILTGEEFPALNQNKVKVVVDSEKMDVQLSSKPLSDTASTATTTSSSSLSEAKKQVGCYAAALLKAKPVKIEIDKKSETRKEKESCTQLDGKSMAEKAQKEERVAEKAPSNDRQKDESKVAPSAPVVITPPSWGGGRSFADVLKKEEAAAASAKTGVAC